MKHRKCCRCRHELGEWDIYVNGPRGPVCGDCIVEEGLSVCRPEDKRRNVVWLTRKPVPIDEALQGWGK
ncbi:hypothetical protein GGQ74_001222 [Desulfobaculum xiamenense]|uniref:Uncharacterized protein n=1 Tax=Desulfobaculum xiamenense TaxID=995050 RepID=A0A846QMA0_9BACT|nr:hypothetical protein [Desulfobaculum xiamenense]NJB67582.1 hypothetical protein [Desulfobaculum xiamenense]